MSRGSNVLLLRSAAGRRLIGGASSSTPVDAWEVFEHLDCRRTARQRVRWRADGSCSETVQISLGQWLRLCGAGIPDALDVMFAPVDFVEVDLLDELRADWRADDTVTWAYARHVHDSRRLEHNLEQLRCWGRYDPTEWGRQSRARRQLIAA